MTSEVQSAAEPIPDADGIWRWISIPIDVVNGDAQDKLMQRIRLACLKKKLAPLNRNFFSEPSNPRFRPTVSYTLLFRNDAELKRYVVAVAAVAKKLGASPLIMHALDPAARYKSYRSTMTVSPGSAPWKFLVKYGFQVDHAVAAEAPERIAGTWRGYCVTFDDGLTFPTETGCKGTCAVQYEPSTGKVYQHGPDGFQHHGKTIGAWAGTTRIPVAAAPVPPGMSFGIRNGYDCRFCDGTKLTLPTGIRGTSAVYRDPATGDVYESGRDGWYKLDASTPVTAAAEPSKQLTLVEMLKTVTDNLLKQPRTVVVGGRKVYLRAGHTGIGGDYPWLILQRADAQTSTRMYVEPVRKDRPNSDLEVHFRDSNTEPDETITQAKSSEDLMRIILARYARYLRTLDPAQAAAEPELETPTARAFVKLIHATPLTENSTHGPFKYSDVSGVRFGFAHVRGVDDDEPINCVLVVRCADKSSARIHHNYLCYYDVDRDAAVINVCGRLKYKFKTNDASALLASITRSVLIETHQITVKAAAEPHTGMPGNEFAKVWMKFYPDARKLSVDGVRVSVEATDAEPTGIEITMPDHEIFFAQENLRDRKIRICVVGRSERGPFPTVDPTTPAHVMLPKILSICVADWKKHQKAEAAAEPDTLDPRKYLRKLYVAADARDALTLPHGITVKARRNQGYCIEASLLGYSYCVVSDFLGKSGSEEHVIVEDVTPLSVRRGKIVATISSARDSADFIHQVVNAVLAHTPGNHAAREANAAAEPGVARGGNLAAALLNLIHRVALHVKCSRESTDKIKSLQEKFEAHTGVSSPRFVVTLGFPGHNSGEGVACTYDGEYLNVWYSGSLGGDIPADLRANARNRIHVKTSNPQAIAEFVGRFYGKCLQEYHAALDRLDAELQGVNEDEP